MSDNENLVHALRAAVLRWNRAITAFGAENGLGDTDIRALIALLDRERAGTPATPGTLAAELRLSSAACTALVDRLTASGLVRRAPDPGDRRRVRLVVTPAAKHLGEAFFVDLLTPLRATASELSPTEAAVVSRFLAALPDPDVSP